MGGTSWEEVRPFGMCLWIGYWDFSLVLLLRLYPGHHVMNYFLGMCFHHKALPPPQSTDYGLESLKLGSSISLPFWEAILFQKFCHHKHTRRPLNLKNWWSSTGQNSKHKSHLVLTWKTAQGEDGRRLRRQAGLLPPLPHPVLTLRALINTKANQATQRWLRSRPAVPHFYP